MYKIDVDWVSLCLRPPARDRHAFPTGTVIFTGSQGSGKTYGMVSLAWRTHERYPDCRVFSNVVIDAPWCEVYRNPQELQQILQKVRNGRGGVLILIDEAHLYWHRKDGIPLPLLAAISQQRKQRLRIVMSTQVFEELDISLRKQITDVVTCRRMGNLLFTKWTHGDTLYLDKTSYQWSGLPYRLHIEKIRSSIADRYDTLQEVATNDQFVDSAWSLPSGESLLAAARPLSGGGAH